MSKRRRHFAVEQAHTADAITNGPYRRPSGSFATTITFATDQIPDARRVSSTPAQRLDEIVDDPRSNCCPVSTTRRKPRLAGGTPAAQPPVRGSRIKSV